MRPEAEAYLLTLYVAGQTPKTKRALANLRSICDEYVPDRYQLDVVDLMEHPELAAAHQILAVPTLVRRRPLPVRKIIGDLSELEKVLVGLDIRVWEA